MKKFPANCCNWHPILFAIYPALFLYSHHLNLFSIGVLVEPVLLSAVSAVLIYAAFRAVLRHPGRAAVSASILVVPFFLYSELRRGFDINLIHVGTHVIFFDRIFFYGWAIIVGVLLWLVLRVKSELIMLNQALFIAALLLVFVEGVKITWGEAQKSRATGSLPGMQTSAGTGAATAVLPNVVYIILDGYGRSDVLREYFAHDNEPFIAELRARGFYIAHESTSNYSQTNLSLASSLNLTYLDQVAQEMGAETRNRDVLTHMIRDSEVLRTLRAHGYRFLTFSSGVFATEFSNADIYLSSWWDRGEFASAVVGMTPILTVLGMISNQGGADWSKAHRERVLFMLDRLAGVSARSGPLFIFAHLLSPHPPFVFDAEGNHITVKGLDSELDGSHVVGPEGVSLEVYTQHYRQQLSYINKRILSVIDDIFSSAQARPIIIIQGDHGPGSRLDQGNADNTDAWERLGILNAYYFPDGNYSALYPAISPVNTFRVIFNKLFTANYKMLPEAGYISPFNKPYALTKIDRQRLLLRDKERDSDL